MVQEKKKKKPEPAKNPKDAYVSESMSEFDIRIHRLPYFSFLFIGDGGMKPHIYFT